MHTVRAWLVFVGAAALAFDDLPLLPSTGRLMASPGWVALALAAASICWSTRSTERTGLSRTVRIAIFLFVYSIVITIASLYWLPASAAGESLVLKGWNGLAVIGMWLFLFLAAPRIQAAHPRALLLGLATALAIMLGGAVLEDIGVIDASSWRLLHATENLQNRVRVSRFEASSLGAGAFCCGAIIASRLRGMKSLVFLGLLSIAIWVYTESRGALLVSIVVLLLLPLAPLLTRVVRRRPGLSIMLSSCASLVLITVSFRLDAVLASHAWRTMGLFADYSDASRGTWALASLKSLLQYPFGMGMAAYLHLLPALLIESIQQALSDYGVRQLVEVLHVARSGSDEAMSPKTMPGVASVYLGFVGLTAVWFLYSRVLSCALSASARSHGATLLAGASIVLISCTYYWSIFSWDQALAFGIFASGLSNFEEER